MRRRLLLVLILAMLPLGVAHAVLEIQITQGINTAVPVAVVPFAWQVPGPPPATDVAAVISADLTRSGRFKAIPDSSMLEKPALAADIHFTNWRILGVNNLVIGRIKPAGAGNYQVEFQLFNVYTGQQLLGLAVLTTPGALRWTAHKISDLIYQKLTGQRGAFATRIAYVEVSGKGGLDRHYALVVADSDGYNPQTVFSSNEPIMSPAWSPDGKYLAYVSFESGLPAIYMQNIYTGKRERLSDRPGLNSAPA
ncbi:MAG: PD40 domain-containing protein, partial [Gammaproteobacteria bacterium]|nr:PD40 domain-containing protein [Gammaproteobacteria bacterium]